MASLVLLLAGVVALNPVWWWQQLTVLRTLLGLLWLPLLIAAYGGLSVVTARPLFIEAESKSRQGA